MTTVLAVVGTYVGIGAFMALYMALDDLYDPGERVYLALFALALWPLMVIIIGADIGWETLPWAVIVLGLTGALLALVAVSA